MIEEGETGNRIPLRLELDPEREPISGRLVSVDGVGEEFVGWLGLGAALERLAVSPSKTNEKETKS